MQGSAISRWLLLGLIALGMVLFLPKLLGKGGDKRQPLAPETLAQAAERAPGEALCRIEGPRFRAFVSTRGASLERFELAEAKYQKGGKPIDLGTTPDAEARQQLRFHLRNEALHPAEWAEWQTRVDLFDWKLVAEDGKRCEYAFEDTQVALRKVIAANERPYELDVTMTVTNRSEVKRTHAATVETTAWRYRHEVEGGMFRVSPFVTSVECVDAAAKTTRRMITDFEPGDFEEFPRSPLHRGDWLEAPGEPRVAAVSNAYFTHALLPVSGPGAPVCQQQIEQWPSATSYGSDPKAGAMYRARLAYPAKELGPGESAEYRLGTYVGPKERAVLGTAAGGQYPLAELIDLGFFSAIAKVLVAFLLHVHGFVPNWGLAIILLTITARVLLFPLALPSIKGMIKMRELKPEMDAIAAKFKDDPQARGLAQLELMQKHDAGPLTTAKGCLPQLASMPVWFALYTTLQTAVELYNIPFLWFPDLSASDPYYVLPFIIGATSFVQQRLIPMTGMDPAQQKMMTYFMPAMFTVFMLFLPAGLGVYMFTNGLLGIAQQQLVERQVRRKTGMRPDGTRLGEIAVRTKSEAPPASSPTGKNKRKADAEADAGSTSESRPLLDKGKA
ncbi:MAG: membrane protein insertase YidC [Polyangiaceae bacterium]|nr:membrane protein insertase YidC [Polyangiaceae bacterium]